MDIGIIKSWRSRGKLSLVTKRFQEAERKLANVVLTR